MVQEKPRLQNLQQNVKTDFLTQNKLKTVLGSDTWILEHTNISHILNNKNIVSNNNNGSNPQTKSISNITLSSRNRTEFLDKIFFKKNNFVITTTAFVKV